MPLEINGVRAAVEDKSGALHACPDTVNLIWVESAGGTPAAICLELPRGQRAAGGVRRTQRGTAQAGTVLHTISMSELSHAICRENVVHLYRTGAPPERPCLTIEVPGEQQREALCSQLLSVIPVLSKPPIGHVEPASSQWPPGSPRSRALFLADLRYVLSQENFGTFVDSVEEALLQLLGGGGPVG